MGFAIVGIMMALMAACRKDDPTPSAEEQQFARLEGMWHASQVLVDGVDISSQYADFYINFFRDGAALKMSVSNGSYAFPLSVDTWKFSTGSAAGKITRGDGVEMKVTFSESTLTLEFTVVDAGGRVSGLEGSFRFVLTRI